MGPSRTTLLNFASAAHNPDLCGASHSCTSLSLSYKFLASWSSFPRQPPSFPVHCSTTSSMYARKLTCECDIVILTAPLVSNTYENAQPAMTPCDVDTALPRLSWPRILRPPPYMAGHSHTARKGKFVFNASFHSTVKVIVLKNFVKSASIDTAWPPSRRAAAAHTAYSNAASVELVFLPLLIQTIVFLFLSNQQHTHAVLCSTIWPGYSTNQ